MPINSTAALLEALKRYNILEPHQLKQAAQELQQRFPDPRALAKELLQRGWVTAFQVNRLFQDKGQELLLGSYLLLEPLGQGGMGQVFKARHQRLDRVDAVKVIRSNLLANPNALERFRREAKAAARLSHPNVITVYDAGESGGTHFLAMEYIVGTDLSQMVKEKGPAPVAQACDYIRQAACGLAHAHEKGLVHRDIKPSNLLVTQTQGTRALGVVKLLDLGLARLAPLGGDEAAHSLTDTGAVVGTADFIAPEQARNARDVDIRADLYSLGCTLYYLLAGKIPFPGETLTEKLIKHQLEEPRPLEVLRPGLPPGLLAVVRKLMAKQAENRYQAPAEVAVALQPFCATAEPLPVEHIQAVPPITAAPPPPVAMPVFSDLSLPSVATRDTMPLGRPTTPPAGRRVVLVLVPVAVVLCMGTLAGALWWALGRKPEPVANTQPATQPTRPGAQPSTMSVAAARQEAARCFERGKQLANQGKHQQAIAEYTRCLELAGDQPEVLVNRGLSSRTLGALENAITDYDKAIRLFQALPRDEQRDRFLARAYFNRASVFYEKRDWDKCIADNTMAIELNPRDPVALNNRGSVYKVRKEWDKALADFGEALRLNPTYVAPLVNRGNTFIGKGDFDQALADFDRVIRQDPDDWIGYDGRGLARLLKGNLDPALEDLNQAIKLNPREGRTYLHRSEVHRKKGNQPQADADYRKAIQLDPRLAKAAN